jgi:peptidoglycan hydrolase-like protein with peptidoglycan-binding domain
MGVICGNVKAQQTNLNDISAYYGFGEMEIIKLDWGIKDLKVADFNGDGRNDIAVVNNIKSRIELLLQKESVGPAEAEVTVDPNEINVNVITPPTRFERQSIALSQKVYSLVCGDLDSDKMMDLAFYGEPRGLYVILQKTADTEANKPKTLIWRTKKKINIDDGLLTSNALVCADLNNDGAADLVLAGRDCVFILLQKDGSLAEPVKYPTSAQMLGIEVGDLNGDSINDLILITSDNEKPLYVRFGLKTGQFGPQVQFPIEKPYMFKLHNLDGEVGDEILIIDAGSGRLICYKLAAEKQKDADWPILFYPLTSGEGSAKRDLVVGDFDGDGLVDVTISEPGAAELVFYRQIAGLGLTEPVRFPAFTDITSLCATDINSNGSSKTELAVLSVKEKIIGISEFKDDRLSFPKPIDLTGEPLAMEITDIDGDGSIDCVYISRDANDIRTFRTIYNLAATNKGVTESVKNKGKTSKTTQKTSGATPALELKKLTSNPDGLKVVDVDQDGLQDVLVFVSYELPILVHQVRKREFQVIDSPKAQASLIKNASPRSTAVADVDGKAGKELLVAEKNFARSLVFSETGLWTIIDQYNAKSTENQISAVAPMSSVEDRNGGENPDGRPAILLLDGQKGQLQILKSGEDKTYRLEKELDVGKWNVAVNLKMLFAPLTGRGTKSILIFDGEKFALITPPSGSEARQYPEQRFSYETQIKDGSFGNLTAGDINSDGQPDIIMVEYKRDHIEILTPDSNNKLIPAMRFKIFEEKSYRSDRNAGKSGVEPRELIIADVTGDGKNDLVTIIHDRIIIYPQD